ncbi:hypothetical protein KFK09_001781 [Dendrobium nobile]|uniref:Reverse transcriptase domain-containing protein n=1 Tax=Dendrobium nobile TaxID=94219 RepID=A0A8T3C967_DENNO|nr:hypothetical protein KFK09_001781 [Dendrobium nobile]
MKKKKSKQLKDLGPISSNLRSRRMEMEAKAFWNCGGAKKRSASLFVKEFVRLHNIIFVGLLETKLTSIERKEVNNLIGDGWNYDMVSSNGLSGGIIVLWNENVADFTMVDSSNQCIIRDLLINNNSKWKVAAVYANKDCCKRRELWEKLEIYSSIGFPMVIAGDFNCLTSKEDKKGGKRFQYTQGSKEMESFFSNNDYHEEKKENLNSSKDKLMEEILEIQNLEAEMGQLSIEECLKLKAKVLELNSIIAKRRLNNIVKIKVEDGNVMEDQNQIEGILISFFKQKWRHMESLLEGWPEPNSTVNCEDKNWLSRDFTEEEVEVVIKDLGNNIVAGCDGITYSFLRSYWEIIKYDFLNAITYFLHHGEMEKSWKDTLILHSNALALTSIGVNISTYGPRISHLLYADDVLLYSEASKKVSLKVKGILSNFSKWTGQSINMEKSGILFGKMVDRRRRKAITRTLGIKEVKQFTYLGIKMALRRLKANDYQFIIEKSLKKINTWGILAPKYGSRIAEENLKRNVSSSWKILTDGGKALQPFLKWSVENGAIIKVFKDKWLLDRSLNEWPSFVVPQGEEPVLLERFIEDNEWNVAELRKECCSWMEHAAAHNGMILNLFFNVLFFSWKARNKLTHDKVVEGAISVAANAVCYSSISKLIVKTNSEQWDVNQPPRLSKNWHPPPPEWLKINVDASLDNSYKTGISYLMSEMLIEYLTI